MSAPPLVSVIMPCRNAGPMLEPALRSVIEQGYRNLEIILVDDGSTDGSAERAARLAAAAERPFRIERCPERGVNQARSHGYSFAQGDYIQWMDADDELGRDKIARQVEELERRPEYDIAYGDWTQRHSAGNRPSASFLHTLDQVEDQLLRVLSLIWYPPHGHLLRRRAADRLHAERGWWPGRPVATDVEYFALAALSGLRFRHVPGAHVIYNVWSPRQISNATAYEHRVRALRDIFRRLQAGIAAGALPVRLSAAHKILLAQNWDVWTMPPGSVVATRLGGRRLTLRHLASGRVLEARPRDALIAREMQAVPLHKCFAHHAVELAHRVPELAEEHAAIVATLDRFAKAGLLHPVWRVEDAAMPKESST